jgi:hypothetical protein
MCRPPDRHETNFSNTGVNNQGGSEEERSIEWDPSRVSGHFDDDHR